MNKNLPVILLCAFYLVLLFIMTNKFSREKSSIEKNYGQILANKEAELIDKKKQIYQQERILIDKNTELANLLDTISGLRKIKQSVIIKKELVYDTIKIKIDSVVYLDFENNTYLKVPANFNKKSKWYSISGTISKDSLVEFSSLLFEDSFQISYGTKDYGRIKNLFKPTVLVVNYRSDNPYSKLREMQSYEIKQRKKPIGIGVSIGYGINKNNFSPYIGIGIQKNIINLQSN